MQLIFVIPLTISQKTIKPFINLLDTIGFIDFLGLMNEVFYYSIVLCYLHVSSK